MKKILLVILIFFINLNLNAQCTVIATVIDNSVNCEDSVLVSLAGYASVPLSETFNCGGPCDPAWVGLGGAQYDNPYDPSPTNDTYFWMGPSSTLPKTLTSGAYNIPSGGQICFDMVYADNGSSPIEPPDEYSEGVGLQYNTGSGWVDIVYYSPSGDTLPANPGPGAPGPNVTDGPFTVWNTFCLDIPVGAFSPNTQFQWIQEDNSGATVDHWGLDNINVFVAGGAEYVFINPQTGAPIGPSPASTYILPTQDFDYEFIYLNTLTGIFCTDTVPMTVNPTDAGPNVTVSCSTLGIELSVDGVAAHSNVLWTPANGLSDQNIHNPYANPVDDQMYTVTSACGVDSTFVNVVPIFEPSITISEDSICDGDISILTANSDQPAISYTYEWSPTTVSSTTAASTNAFPTINTTYYLEMVSDSGCVRNDSVQIYVGAVPKTINYTGEMRICTGDSTQVTVLPVQPTFFDNFEIGANPSIWDSTYNATANTDCGTAFPNSTNALHFNGAGQRGVQTFPLDASLGGNISFWLIYGSGAAPCDDVAFNAEMQLQYSIDGGVNWIVIRNFENTEHDIWELQSETVPIAAQTTSTLFRLHQDFNNPNNQNNWAIDDFLMELNCSGTNCVQYEYSWTPTATVSNPTIANPFFFPNESTWYSVAISPEGFSCNAAADSILISVDEYPITITPGDTFLCESAPILLEINNSDLNASCSSGGVSSGTEFTLEMFDTFGDGWNGNNIDVLADGVVIGNYSNNISNTINLTQENATFTVPSGSTIDFVYNSGGFVNEIGFNLLDIDGTTLISFATGSVSLVDGSTFFTIITGCVDTMFWSSNDINTLSSVTSLSPVATPNVTTTYIANVVNTNGCLFQDSVTVELYESVTTLTDNVEACFGDSIQLQATGADTYAWTSNLSTNTLNDTAISNPTSGTNTTTWYYVNYNTQGCEEEDSVRVTILNLAAPVINNGISPVNVCEGETVELTTPNLSGFTYTWSGQSSGTGNSIEVSEGGQYFVEYFDGNCTNQASVIVSEKLNPTLDFSSFDKNLCCNGDEIVIDFATMITNHSLSEIDEVYWNGMEVSGTTYTYSSESANFTQLDAIKVRSIFGCEGEGELAIETNCLNPSLSSSIPDTVYFENPTVFDLNISETEAGADNITYTWSTTEPNGNLNAIQDPSVQDATFNGATAGEGTIYETSVTVTGEYEGKLCPETVEGRNYEVVVIPDPIYPDAFSPNADGLNDVYRPILNRLLTMTEMRVYNRWGDLVYNMTSAQEKRGWDGKFLNKDQAPGLYTYFIKVSHPDGSDYLQEGQINLIR